MRDIDTLELFGDSVCAIKGIPFVNKSILDMYVTKSLRSVFFVHPSEPVEAHDIIDNLSVLSASELDDMVRWSTFNLFGQSMTLNDVVSDLVNFQSASLVVRNINAGEFELFFSFAEKPASITIDGFLRQFAALGGYELDKLQEFVFSVTEHSAYKLSGDSLSIFVDDKPIMGLKLIGTSFIVSERLRGCIPIQFMRENRVPRRDFYFGDLNFCLSGKNFSEIITSMNPTQNPHN